MKLPSVLIIDDSESDRYILKRLIKKGKISECIFEVADGDEALEFFKDRVEKEKQFPGRFPPVVVFLDINMPRMGGFEFLSKFSGLREDMGYETVIFMMFTTSEREEEQSKALSYDFVKGYIMKQPMSPDDLKAQIIKAGGGDFI